MKPKDSPNRLFSSAEAYSFLDKLKSAKEKQDPDYETQVDKIKRLYSEPDLNDTAFYETCGISRKDLGKLLNELGEMPSAAEVEARARSIQDIRESALDSPNFDSFEALAEALDDRRLAEDTRRAARSAFGTKVHGFQCTATGGRA
jgi:hypothetical protein